MWGCFRGYSFGLFLAPVFPTHVGVFLMKKGLHYGVIKSSPRMWGCFQLYIVQIEGQFVFPTHVGVFLPLTPSSLTPSCLPHACGGVSSIL